MATQPILQAHRVAGLLLILAFIAFAVGATLPLVGERGNSRIFTLPAREHLLAVAGMAGIWRWANILMGAAFVVLLAGLAILTSLLEGAGERILSRLGLLGMALAAVLWLVFSAFRATVTVAAAQELAATGVVPPYYEPLARWAFALFVIYAAAGFCALAAYGGSILRVGMVPAWAGWGTVIFSLVTLAGLLVVGDTLPAFHYLPPLLIGLLLLRG